MILSGGFEITEISFGMFLQAIAVIIIVYAAYKKLKEIINDFNIDHERKKKWDVTADILKEKEKVWDDAVADVNGMREFLMRRYDSRLDDIEKRIDENHSEDDAKMQEIRADVMILAEAIRAVLEGQIEQGCNGPVKSAKEKLDHYLIESLGR